MIGRSLSWLDAPKLKRRLAEVSHTGLKKRTDEQREFETAIKRLFYSNSESDHPYNFTNNYVMHYAARF